MKRLKIVLVLMLVLLCTISGCRDNQFSYEISTTKKLEEYDTLWKFLEENFSAYLNDLENLGVDLKKLKDKYRKKVKSTENFDEYYNVLNEMTINFRSIGHIEIYSPDEFLRLNEIYKYFEKTKKDIEKRNPYEVQLAQNSYDIYSSFFLKKDSIYRYKEINNKINSKENLFNEVCKIEEKQSSNLEIKEYKKEKTLYIKYPNFLENYREGNKKYIIQELNKFPYKKIVVDIHGNPGDNTPLWRDLVSLLSSEPVNFREYECFKGKEAVKFAKKIVNNTQLDISKNLVGNKTIICNEKSILLNGNVKNKPKKIYIIQGNNFSAAEEFCSFSKNANWGIRIGQPIGGSGQGTNYFYRLSNSNLLMRLIISYPCNQEGQLLDITIEPDISMEYDIHDILEYVFSDKVN